MLRCIDRDWEAASGDGLDNGAEPVFISRRETGRDVITIHLRHEGRILTGTIVAIEEELSLDDIVALFARTYLGTLTMDFYRGQVDEVVLIDSRGGPGARFAYPSTEVLFG